MAFQDLCNLHLISYEDCLIDDGEFIILYDLYYSILEAFSSLRSFCFCFEVKSKYRSQTVLGLQLLYSAAEENSVLLQCSSIFVLSTSVLHVMFWSPLEIVAFNLLAAKNNMRTD